MRIKLEQHQFEGPLDLLLQLIEDQQMDITALALSEVTEQFLNYVRSLQEKNPTNLADFLIIAAKLLVIKSKALLPNLDLGADEEEAAFDLTAQLLTYKKFREVAKFLKNLEARRKQSWSRETEFTDRVTFLPDPEVTVDVLAGTLGKLATELKEIVKLPEKVLEKVVSITEKINHIQALIGQKVETRLSELLKDASGKTDVIVTFLALLELTKQRILSLDQEEKFADIIIKKN
ncbi:MAG TPA: segregation/condensation protein A [Patescibacteria group bacterium]|nr:segregation/condensation protein A [Patescibacteria group bacterium]